MAEKKVTDPNDPLWGYPLDLAEKLRREGYISEWPADYPHGPPNAEYAEPLFPDDEEAARPAEAEDDRGDERKGERRP